MLKRGHQLKLGFGVVGFAAQTGKLEKSIKSTGYKVVFAKQKKLLGTAHAVRTALKIINPNKFKNILVLFGDDHELHEPKRGCFHRCDELFNPDLRPFPIRRKPMP